MSGSIYRRISLAVIVSAILFAQQMAALRMWPKIKSDLRLFEMAWEQRSRGLETLANMENLTLFLPSSKAFSKFHASTYGISNDDEARWRELLIYSSVDGKWRLSDIRKEKKIASKLKFPSNVYLFVNTFTTKDGLVTTINGARIIESDIIAENGIIHILDMFIAPVGSPNTIAQYLTMPELPNLEFTAILMSSLIVPELSNKTNSTSGLFTSFSPNDSYLYPMPGYGKTPLFANNALLKKVYKSHMVEGEALFLPDGMSHITSRHSMLGRNDLIHFYRWKGNVYVINNRVHAKVTHANIATNNGVIHVIDNLLHYVYHNAVQMARYHAETDIWGQLLDKLPNATLETLTARKVTVFMPTDEAFSRMPLFYQAELRQEIRQDFAMLERVLFGHFVDNDDIDSSRLRDGQKIKLMNDQTLTVREIRGDVYLQTQDQRMRSKIEVRDIGITNGVVHLISNVLFADNYTVWQALEDIPELSRIHDLIKDNFGELRTLMSDKSPITVFLPRNIVLDGISDYIHSLFPSRSEILLEALRGHIVTGLLSSSELIGSQSHVAWSGKIVHTSWSENSDGIFVSGGHVTSQVILSDIYCSNGVLHIIDDILHMSTRTIWAELLQRNDLARYFSHMVKTIEDPAYKLDDKDRNYTVFVPLNDAFAYLPWETVDTLLWKVNWTKEVLKAHVVEGEVRPLENLPSEVALKAEKNLIYILRRDERVCVVNNNMMAEVVHSNIPSVNGWLHLIDHILTVPYVTVAETLKAQPELWAFNKLMQSLPEYQELLASPNPKHQKVNRVVTLFVPSTRYINTLEPDQMDNIKSNMQIIRKLFQGHVLPDVRMDEEFLRQYDGDYRSRTVYNMSFTIFKKDGSMFVGAGFDIQPLDLIGRGLGCSDGIIHVIDGFLNYSPYTVWERLQREPGVSLSFEVLDKLASPTDRELLNDQHKIFTFLMPNDFALDLFTFNDLFKLHNLPFNEKQRIFWRHVINGSTILYEDLKNGHTELDSLPRDVSIKVVNEAVHVTYSHVSTPIITRNLIACNGVIHIMTQYLYDINMQRDETVSTPTARTSLQTTRAPSARTGCDFTKASKVFTLAAFFTWMLINCSLLRTWGR